MQMYTNVKTWPKKRHLSRKNVRLLKKLLLIKIFLIKSIFIQVNLIDNSNLKTTNLDKHLKRFTTKSKLRIDLDYPVNSDEKLKVNQQLPIAKPREVKNLKEQMSQIKKKTYQLPPIESRMDSNMANQSSSFNLNIYEKEPSFVIKETSLLDIVKEPDEVKANKLIVETPKEISKAKTMSNMNCKKYFN